MSVERVLSPSNEAQDDAVLEYVWSGIHLKHWEGSSELKTSPDQNAKISLKTFDKIKLKIRGHTESLVFNLHM